MVCHKLSHFSSWVFIIDFPGNCRRLREDKKFSRNPGQFKCVTRETRYHVSRIHHGTLNAESIEPSSKISSKT